MKIEGLYEQPSEKIFFFPALATAIIAFITQFIFGIEKIHPILLLTVMLLICTIGFIDTIIDITNEVEA